LSEKLLKILEYSIGKATKSGADMADAIIYDADELAVSKRLGKIESIENSKSKAIGLRVMIKNNDGIAQAIVSSEDISRESLDNIITKAISMAKAAPADKYTALAASDLLATNIVDLDLFDDSHIDQQDLINWSSESEDEALSIKGINNSDGAGASYSRTNIALATSEGFCQSYSTSLFSNSVSVVAGKGTNKETDYDYTVARHISDMISPKILGMNAGKNTMRKLNPRSIKTCHAPVVYDPRQSKSLMSSLASAINGSAVSKGTTFLLDKMGTKIFKDKINIFDNPLIIRGIGSHPFDGEGIKVQKNVIIEEGKLSSWLLDTYTANKLGLKSTGNATRSTSSIAYPASSNFYMEAGDISVSELIADIKQGLYVTDTFGMGINSVTGDYSQGAAGFWIENGKIEYPVAQITIAGNLLDMFSNLTPANDLEFRYSINCPTVRIERMVIAGE
jgi:PmbA protein